MDPRDASASKKDLVTTLLGLASISRQWSSPPLILTRHIEVSEEIFISYHELSEGLLAGYKCDGKRERAIEMKLTALPHGRPLLQLYGDLFM